MTVSGLFERLQAQAAAGGSMDLPQIREDIHTEHERATTSVDREALLEIHKITMDHAEKHMRGEDLAAFRKLRRQDYIYLLIREATIGDSSGYINPQKMGQITAREVKAGRMAPGDDFHELASAGSAVLKPLPTRAKFTLFERVKALFSTRRRSMASRSRPNDQEWKPINTLLPPRAEGETRTVWLRPADRTLAPRLWVLNNRTEMPSTEFFSDWQEGPENSEP
jgi:hypothetical protein